MSSLDSARFGTQDRRTALSWLLGSTVAASLASFFYPVARFLNPPEVAENPVNEIAAGKVSDLKPNSGKMWSECPNKARPSSSAPSTARSATP